MMIFLGKKPLTPHLLSAEVNLLVFLTVGKELLCPAEANRENSAIQYVVDLRCFEMNRHYISSQMAVLMVLGKGADFRTGGSSAHASPWISKGVRRV